MSQPDRYTWDQAAIINAWSPAAFEAVGIKAATVRQWAARGHITAIGIGPNGCRLYSYEDVIKKHDQTTPSLVAQTARGCHTVSTGGRPIPKAG